MSNPASSLSFYVDLDAGLLDDRLDVIYREFKADGEIYQASEVVNRALEITEDPDARALWIGRRDQRLDELLMFDTGWLPDRLLPGSEAWPFRADVVLGMFKSSLPQSVAGYTIRTQKTLEAQQSAGFEVVPCTPIGFGDQPVEVVGTVEYRRLDPTVSGSDWNRSETLDRNASALLHVAHAVQPALVHAASGFYGPDMGLVALAVAKSIQRPFVYELRGMLPETWSYHGDGLKVHRQASWLRWSQELRLAQDASAVVVIGEHLKAQLVAGGTDPTKVFVVPNGVDTNAFRPFTIATKPSQIGMDDSFPTVGYISNLGEREGHSTLVDAIALLRDRGRSVNCLIVGDGPMMSEIQQQVNAKQVESLVRLTGLVPHDEVMKYYSALDVFVVPRLDDRAARYTTPLKPYEAMAMKIPLVVSDLPALKEIVGEEERGTTFYCGSASSLAEAIQATLSDVERTNRRVDRAFEWVARERRWSDNARRYREAFTFASESFEARWSPKVET
ncbi:MAG: glycosyltransferase family 4 protein [Acidimicrobiia bacterium]